MVPSLAARVAEVVELRDGYFEKQPEGTEHQRKATVREAVDRVVKELPASTHAAEMSPVEAVERTRLYNALIEYDPEAERLVSRCVRIAPSAEAYLEAGIVYMKRNAYHIAIDCFEASVAESRSSSALRELSVALRLWSSEQTDLPAEERRRIVSRSVAFAEQAVGLDEENGDAKVCLGNARLSEFFSAGQAREELMEGAISSYRAALSLGKTYRNPDVHLNLATALIHRQELGEAVAELRVAVRYDPDNGVARERRDGMEALMHKLHAAMEKGAKLKRRAELIASLQPADAEPFTAGKARLQLTPSSALSDGANSTAVWLGRVLAVVPTHNMPYYCVVSDSASDGVSVLAVQNVGEHFGLLIGDAVAVAQPRKSSSELTVDGSDVSVCVLCAQSPFFLSRNRRPIPSSHTALTHMTVKRE